MCIWLGNPSIHHYFVGDYRTQHIPIKNEQMSSSPSLHTPKRVALPAAKQTVKLTKMKRLRGLSSSNPRLAIALAIGEKHRPIDATFRSPCYRIPCARCVAPDNLGHCILVRFRRPDDLFITVLRVFFIRLSLVKMTLSQVPLGRKRLVRSL